MVGGMRIYGRQERAGWVLKKEMLSGQLLHQDGKSGFGHHFLSVIGSGATGLVYDGKFDVKTYLELIRQISSECIMLYTNGISVHGESGKSWGL